MKSWGKMTPVTLITVIVLLVVSSSSLATQKDGNEPTAAELRLPDKLTPIWYNLTIKPYLPGFVDFPDEKNLTFEASLAMKFGVNAATDKIVVNALNLNFSDDLQSYTLKQEFSEDTVPQVTDVVINKTLQMVIFTLSGQLKTGGEYIFQFDYTGPISNFLAGLYLSRYTDDKGEMRYTAVTQMEPTDARRMVPCFDEPQMKAIWMVRVVHPSGTSAISNGIEMIDAAKTEDPDWLMTTFKATLPMSPYLIALAVSDFDFVEGNTIRGTRFRIWARKEALNETSYALEAGITALEYFEDFYGIPFPLEKQDMMALPDFSAGAMENWGLVTYREKYLLYNSALDTPQQKQHLAAVVAHELAHQWFGNLVTMKWWNDLWLNEGFATFMEYLGADAISHGDFRMNDTFLVDAVNVAFEKDARATSHPLFFPIDKAEDVSEAFDPITYEKGGSIIHMIEDVMGAENFKKGLTIYLNRYQLSNADHNDLWDALSEAVPETLLGWNGSKLDIHEFASRWIEQMGYPVVEITRLDSKTVQLKQKRFKVDNTSLEAERFREPKYGYKYDSPLWYEINGKEEPLSWLHEEEPKTLSVEPDDLLIVNNRARGFYRVNYDEIGWQRITKQLLEDHTQIDMRSRTRLIEDAFALAEADQLPYEVPLKMMEYLDKEDEFLPWQMALGGMSLILGYYGDEPEAQHARDFLGSLISPLYNRINWDELGTSYLDDKRFFKNQMDYMIIGQYCYIRNVNCTSQGIDLFKKDFMDPCDTDDALSSECSKVPTPVRTLSYCEGVSQGAEREWNKVFAMYNKERVQVERERLLYGLTCSRDTFTLKKLLDLASDLNDHSIRLQDVGTVFALVSRRPVGNKLLFDYFIDNWPRLYSDLKNDQHLLSRVISSGTSVHGTRYLKQLEQFINENKKETSRLDVFSQQLENARTATQWIERNYDALSKWFKTQNEMRAKQ